MYFARTLICVVALIVQIAHCLPYAPDEWDLVFDEGSTEERLTSINEFAQELGVTEEFLVQLKANWEKALEEEKAKDRLRQAGGIGDFFGLGGGAGGGAGGGGGGGGGGAEDDEDDGEDDGATMAPGPGAAGVLTGLLGIFSGLGTLNPQRVIQSTVNFFPPHQRPAAQLALNSAFGIHNATTTTLAPLTDAPPRNGSGSGRPGVIPMLIANVNSTKSLARNGVATTVPPKAETTTRKKLVFKETSLLQDFEEAAIKLTPVVVVEDVKEDKTNELSGIEKDFADTADNFKVGEKEIAKSVNSSSTTPHTEIEVIEISATQGNQIGVEEVNVEHFGVNATTPTSTGEVEVVEISATQGSQGGKEEENVENLVDANSNTTAKPEILTVIVKVAK